MAATLNIADIYMGALASMEIAEDLRKHRVFTRKIEEWMK